MPRLPGFVPSVSQNPVNTGRYSAPGTVPLQDQTGEQMQQLGRGVMAAGVAAGEITQDLERQEEIEAREADTRLSELDRNDYLNYRQLEGKAAVDGWKDAQQKLQDNRKAVGSELKSNRARAIFTASADKRYRSLSDAFVRHRDEQQKSWDVAQSNSRSMQGVLDYRARGDDEKAAAAARVIAITEKERVADLMGRSPEEKRLMVQKVTTDMHSGRIDDLVAQNRATDARSYLEKHRGEMDPDAANAAAKDVQHAGVKDKAMRAVDEMTAKGMTVEQMQGWAAAGHQAGTITAEERDAIEDRAAWYGRDQAHKLSAAANSIRGAAEKWLVDNPLQSVSAMPTGLYRGLEATGQLGDIQTFAKTRRYTTDPQAFLRALRATDDEWKSLTKEQVERAFRGKLDDDDLKVVHAMHEAALQPKYNKLSILSPEKMVEQAARDIGILPVDPDEKPRPEQLQTYQEFRKDLNAQLDTWQDNHKKRAEEADVQKLLDARAAAYKQKVLVRESETTRGFPEFVGRALDALGGRPGRMDESFAEVEISSLTNEQQGRAFVRTGPDTVMAFKDIPQSQRDRIREYIESKGQVATLSSIADYWVRLGKPR